MTPTHFALPRDPRSDYILNKISFLSVVVPARALNYVFDPECLAFHFGYSNEWDAVGTLLASDINLQRRGLYSIHVSNIFSPGTGIRYRLPQAMPVSQRCTFSFDHYGYGEYTAIIEDRLTGDVIASKLFNGKGFWQRIHVSGSRTPGSLVNLAVYTTGGLIPGDYADGFNVDGFQFEATPYPTSFISGDLAGFPGESPTPYAWTGGPHASASYRLGTTRTGGHEIGFHELGLHLLELEGLGMIDPNHSLQEYALDHGSDYSCTRAQQRSITVSGSVYGAGIDALEAVRQKLVSAFNPLFGKKGQPVRLKHQLYDCDEPLTEAVQFDALYEGGLGMKINGIYTEKMGLSLICPDPFIYSVGDRSQELGTPTGTVPDDLVGIPIRDETGQWQIGTSVPNGQVLDLEIGPDGYMYCLVTAGGATSSLIRWDGYTWVDTIDFIGRAGAMAAAPDGNLYITGDFNFAEAVVADSIIAYNVFSGGVTTLQNTVLSAAAIGRAIVYHPPTGQIILGGRFTTVTNTPSGAITATNVAAYNITTGVWSPMGILATEGLAIGSPTNPTIDGVRALVVSPSGVIFAGGRFSAIVSFSICYNLARFDFTTPDSWDYVDGLKWENAEEDAYVNTLVFAPNGNLYIGGRFNNSDVNNLFCGSPGCLDPGDHSPLTNICYIPDASGDLTNAIFFQVRPIGNGFNETYTAGVTTVDTVVNEIAINCDGEVWVAGNFYEAYYRQSGSPIIPPRPSIFSAGVITFGPDHAWRVPEITFGPLGYSATTTTPIFNVEAIAFGGHCGSAGIISPFGESIPGNTAIAPGDFGAATDFQNSLFIGFLVTDLNAAYILFPARTVVDIGCSVDVRPILRILGPGKVLAIKNRTTGRSIEFSGDYTLVAKELLTIDLSGRLPKVYSNVLSTGFSLINDLSQLAGFYLTTGTNEIDVVMNNALAPSGAISPDTAGWIQYQPRFLSVDAVSSKDCM